jgi:hypothetical protein
MQKKINIQSYKNLYFSYKGQNKKLINLKFLRKFITSDSNVYIDKKTGILRSDLNHNSESIAKYWNKIFKKNKKKIKQIYDPSLPFSRSRLHYVLLTALDFIKNKKIKIKKIKICDYATGEGYFLKIAERFLKNEQISATENSLDLCKLLKKKYEVHNTSLGTEISKCKIKRIFKKKPNFGFLSWTLCNCIDPIEVLKDIHASLDEESYLCVAESSRILVPFKKKINEYFNKKIIQDAHPFHFSKNSLSNLLSICGFKTVFYNHYKDSDVLLIIAKKTNIIKKNGYVCDKPAKVLNFMRAWNQYSKMF